MEEREIAGRERLPLLRRLENAGCRTEEALDRVFGDEEFFEEMLMEFLSDPAFGELTEAMADRSAKNAFAAAHTLRGAAMTLGVLPVGEPAVRLTELLRGTGEIPDAAWKTFDELESGLAVVRQAAKG